MRYITRRTLSYVGRMLNKVKVVLIDLSGTLHIEDTAIKGAQEGLQELRSSGLKVKFVTNTTKEPLRCLHERLVNLGFTVDKSEIFTSLTAARRLVESKHVRPLLLLEESAKEDFEGVNQKFPNAVVIGLAPSCFHYEQMNEAFRMVLEGAPLIAIHKARYFKKKDGMALGPGPFVTALEYATDRQAQVVGKPQASFFLEAMSEFNCKPEECVMIGDDIRDDIGGAMASGMAGILVQTGKYRAGDESKVIHPPSEICRNFPAAVEALIQSIK